MSGLDFLALVLQSSNSFDMKAFVQVLFSFYILLFTRRYSIDGFGVLVSHWGFLIGLRLLSLFFFRLKSAACFPVKTHVFEWSFNFCTFVCNHGALICACSQDYLKVEHVGACFLGSSLAKMQQF